MNWPKAVFLGMEAAWLVAGCAALGAALLFALGREPAPPSRRTGLALLGFGLPALVALFKLAQFHSFQLMWDSGVSANLAWNFVHGRGLSSSVIGDGSYLGVHFAFTTALLGPVLLLWESAAALALLQGVAVGSVICGLWLAAARPRDPWSSWVIAALACAQPVYHDLVGAVIDSSVFAAPLAIWSLVLWTKGFRLSAAGCAALLLSTREQVPFMLAGLGVWLACRRKGRRVALGLSLAAASALLFFAEARLISTFKARDGLHYRYWDLFRELGGSEDGALQTLLLRPWAFAVALVWPPARLWMQVKLLAWTALLPLGAGAAALPALVVWLPHQWAGPEGPFHELNAHAGAFAYVPLMMACAAGLERLSSRPGLRRAFRVAALTVAGVLFLRNARFYLPQPLPSAWAAAVPRALALIPADAAVWCDEFLLPHLALRARVRTLPGRLPNPNFETRAIVPDRVLFSWHWARLGDPDAIARMFRFFKANGYEQAWAEADLVLLCRPRDRPAVPWEAIR